MGDGRRTCCCGEWDIEKGNLTIGIYEVLIGSFVFLMQLMVDFIWKKDSDDDAAEIQEQKQQQQQLEEAEMILPGLTQSHVYVFGSILLVLGVWRIFGAMSNDPTCMLFFTILDFIKSLGINIYVVTSLARSSWVGTYIMLHSFTLTLSLSTFYFWFIGFSLWRQFFEDVSPDEFCDDSDSSTEDQTEVQKTKKPNKTKTTKSEKESGEAGAKREKEAKREKNCWNKIRRIAFP